MTSIMLIFGFILGLIGHDICKLLILEWKKGHGKKT
jgi:hypothetical protein